MLIKFIGWILCSLCLLPICWAEENKGSDLIIQQAMAGDGNSEIKLGLMYFNGSGGLTRDYSAAASWFKKAADKNIPEAEYLLGIMFAQGLGMPVDERAAIAMFSAAANQHFAMAQAEMGYVYYFGTGLPKDYELAFYWTEKASLQGVAKAQALLGQIYLLGRGVEKDKIKAYAWIATSAKMDTQFVSARDKVGTLLTPDEINQAEKMSIILYTMFPPSRFTEAFNKNRSVR